LVEEAEIKGELGLLRGSQRLGQDISLMKIDVGN